MTLLLSNLSFQLLFSSYASSPGTFFQQLVLSSLSLFNLPSGWPVNTYVVGAISNLATVGYKQTKRQVGKLYRLAWCHRYELSLFMEVP